MLVGNTRELWKPFIAHCGRNRAWLEACENPLDDYCEAAVLEALKDGELSRHAGCALPQSVPWGHVCCHDAASRRHGIPNSQVMENVAMHT